MTITCEYCGTTSTLDIAATSDDLENIKFKATARYAMGWSDPRNAFSIELDGGSSRLGTCKNDINTIHQGHYNDHQD